jgi:acyl-CoA synthetase (NDP forming)
MELKGKLYSVHVNPKTGEQIEAMGVKNYPSLLDVPEPVDLVIVTAPRAATLGIVDDCIKKNVAAVHFFTSGFAETNTKEGRELQRQVKEKAEAANLHLIGPNCMGIYNPEVGVRQEWRQYLGPAGEVGIISQSGTHAITFSREAHLQALDVNKSVSFGNGIIIDSPDYLEYFGTKPEIKAIGMYLEGVRDGARFLKILKEVTAKKPVVIWKGGRTAEGGRAIASHTGSLAVSQTIWDTAIRQCGALKAAGMIQLIDTLKALIYLPPINSKKVGIAGGSGGQSVDIADVFGEAGLEVPPLTKKSSDEFATFFSLIGGGYANPIDTGNPNREQMKRIMEVLEKDTNLDNLVLLTSAMVARLGRPSELEDNIKLMKTIKERSNKPVMAIACYSTPEDMGWVMDAIQKFHEKGIPAFPSIERGAFALKNAFDYYRMKNGTG